MVSAYSTYCHKVNINFKLKQFQPNETAHITEGIQIPILLNNSGKNMKLSKY